MVAPTEKVSLLGFQFDSKHSLSSLSHICLVSLIPIGAILLPSELLSSCVCFSILISYGSVDPLGVFPLFLKKVVDIIASKLSIIFRRLFLSDRFRSVLGMLM